MCNDMKKLTFTLFHIITLFTRQTDRPAKTDTDRWPDRQKEETDKQTDRQRQTFLHLFQHRISSVALNWFPRKPC